MADTGDPVIPTLDLHPCSICNRTFLPESLEKHFKACEKNANKKIKVFDSTKQRVQGTDLAQFLPIKKKSSEKAPIKAPQSSWKENHVNFIRAIRAARGGKDPDLDAGPSEIIRPSNHEQCPTCDRHFGPKAYDRHIEWCREKQARQPSKANTSTQAVMAKERLDARIKYRAPLLNKSRREITREKYSPSRSSGGGDTGPRRTTVESQINISLTRSRVSPKRSPPDADKESASTTSLQRTHQRSSFRQISPPKRPSLGNRNATTERKVSLIRQRDNSPTKTPQREVIVSPPRMIRKSFNESNQKSRNLSPEKKTKSDTDEGYDPFLSAKRQLQELLSHGDAFNSDSDTKSFIDPRHLETSPTSAFSKYTCTPSNDSSDNIKGMDFNDLVISGQSSKLQPSSKSSSISDNLESYNNIRDIAASLSSLSICSLEDINLQNGNVPNMSSINGNRRNSKYRAKLENATLALRRSVSLFHPDVKSNKQDSSVFEDLRQSSENEDDFPSAIYPNGSFSLSSLGIPIPSHQNPTYADDEFEEEQVNLIKKKSADSRRLRNKPQSEEEFSSPDNITNNSHAGKCSADSAYSSLNRKSPVLGIQGNFTHSDNNAELSHFDRRCLSSSESESSMPPRSVQLMREDLPTTVMKQIPLNRNLVSELQPESIQKLSKFCHECGSKFPLTMAKFCCECGVKRISV